MGGHRTEEIRSSALMLLQTYLETEDQRSLDEFSSHIHDLSQHYDFETMLQIYEEAIKMFPDKSQLYYNAAKVCKAWSKTLASDYFDSKGVLGMEFNEWRAGEGTPYRQVVGLRHKAAGYLERVVELSTDLSSETMAAIKEDIFDLRYR